MHGGFPCDGLVKTGLSRYGKRMVGSILPAVTLYFLEDLNKTEDIRPKGID